MGCGGDVTAPETNTVGESPGERSTASKRLKNNSRRTPPARSGPRGLASAERIPPTPRPRLPRSIWDPSGNSCPRFARSLKPCPTLTSSRTSVSPNGPPMPRNRLHLHHRRTPGTANGRETHVKSRQNPREQPGNAPFRGFGRAKRSEKQRKGAPVFNVLNIVLKNQTRRKPLAVQGLSGFYALSPPHPC